MNFHTAFGSFADLNYFCRCATSNENIDEESAENAFLLLITKQWKRIFSKQRVG